MNTENSKPPRAGIDPPESRLDRTVRLALACGQCKTELREARAEIDRLRALLPPALDLAPPEDGA